MTLPLFDADAVRARLPFGPLVQALRAAFAAGAEVPLRHAHALGNAGTVLLMPAWRTGGRLGVKLVTVFPGNGSLGLPGVHGVYALFDANTGVPLAVLDGSELTARRTAAASALAASYLARQQAERLLVVGAGRVAAQLPEAYRSVFPGLRQVLVWARRPPAAQALANQLCENGFAAAPTATLPAAARQADIICCATPSQAPLIEGGWLAPGTHLDLIGSFTPAMREADGACFSRAGVWVDTEEAMSKAGDVLQAIAEGAFDKARLRGTLADLVRGRCPGRADAQALTLFKSVGNAIEDLAAAELVFDGPG